MSKGEGINAVNDVINEVDKCGARETERELAREKYIIENSIKPQGGVK